MNNKSDSVTISGNPSFGTLAGVALIILAFPIGAGGCCYLLGKGSAAQIEARAAADQKATSIGEQ